jgi:hypothetical protein
MTRVKTTNGDTRVLFPWFAVVVFDSALEFVGLHESSARAHSGLIKIRLPQLRLDPYVQTHLCPVSCS